VTGGSGVLVYPQSSAPVALRSLLRARSENKPLSGLCVFALLDLAHSRSNFSRTEGSRVPAGSAGLNLRLQFIGGAPRDWLLSFNLTNSKSAGCLLMASVGGDIQLA
jgi:hypothetical protein